MWAKNHSEKHFVNDFLKCKSIPCKKQQTKFKNSIKQMNFKPFLSITLCIMYKPPPLKMGPVVRIRNGDEVIVRKNL